ncbi:mpv17 pmp22 family protein [Rutstroemia sp. NJR-2017a BBW]|nr:mpv17 pmp22 family protein [Rutstroemia sp. NJR-2017a BBW]
MPSALINTTVQSCILSGASNILAQFISARQQNTTFTLDWTPVFQFILYAALSAPPNFFLIMTRQSLLESAFPSKKSASRSKSENSKSAGADESLSIFNTLIKVFLDQTVLATFNVFLFLVTFALFKGATTQQAVQNASEEYWDMMKAGWTLWPWVSLGNFAVVKSVQGRALVGGLAGIVWNVWLGMVQNAKS